MGGGGGGSAPPPGTILGRYKISLVGEIQVFFSVGLVRIYYRTPSGFCGEKKDVFSQIFGIIHSCMPSLQCLYALYVLTTCTAPFGW